SRPFWLGFVKPWWPNRGCGSTPDEPALMAWHAGHMTLIAHSYTFGSQIVKDFGESRCWRNFMRLLPGRKIHPCPASASSSAA
ncbi:hypothetical protein, partial [Bordetella bronchiseptica]|uniref:hypothetical protein n=1 Tax=Bordetella bronchiseptica TaxID=518 RepID=UPI001F336C38